MSKTLKQPLRKTSLSILTLTILLVFSFTLSGCGGGGGGSSSAMMPGEGDQEMPGGGNQEMIGGDVSSSSISRIRMLDGVESVSDTIIPEIANNLLKAAAASRRGSNIGFVGTTTQSSTTAAHSSTFSDERTADRVYFSAEYDQNGELQFSHQRIRFGEFAGTITTSTMDTNVLFTRLNDAPQKGWKGVETEKDDTEDTRYWDAFSDIESAGDTDYLTIGYWVIVSKADQASPPMIGSEESPVSLGVAATGRDLFFGGNVPGLTGTANYEGPATGIVMNKANANTTPELDYFNARATLTADFGDATALGTVSGEITDGITKGGRTLPELTLESASIALNSTGRAVNFSRPTSGVTDQGVLLRGVWGGRLFSNGTSATEHPGSMAGTFGANSADELISILGAFAAHKN